MTQREVTQPNLQPTCNKLATDCVSRMDVIEFIHKTICGFFDIASDDSEEPISDKDKLLLEVNKAICNGIRDLPSAQPESMCVNLDIQKITTHKSDFSDLDDLPTAEPKKGKWIRHYCEDGHPDGWQCGQCAEWYYFGEKKPNFCPNCGADMRGEEE